VKSGKFLIICLVAVLVFSLTGCARSDATDNDSSTLSIETGVELPDEEFDSNEETQVSENTNTNDEDDEKTPSSEEDNNSLSENTNTTSSQPSDETPSEVVDEEDDASSDDVSQPTKSEDGSVELPFDKW